jgi:hypothetical protein
MKIITVLFFLYFISSVSISNAAENINGSYIFCPSDLLCTGSHCASEVYGFDESGILETRSETSRYSGEILRSTIDQKDVIKSEVEKGKSIYAEYFFKYDQYSSTAPTRIIIDLKYDYNFQTHYKRNNEYIGTISAIDNSGNIYINRNVRCKFQEY